MLVCANQGRPNNRDKTTNRTRNPDYPDRLNISPLYPGLSKRFRCYPPTELSCINDSKASTSSRYHLFGNVSRSSGKDEANSRRRKIWRDPGRSFRVIELDIHWYRQRAKKYVPRSRNARTGSIRFHRFSWRCSSVPRITRAR